MLEIDEPGAKGPGEALANAPGNYSEVPRLGPPLPGDLGRPILEQQRALEGLDSAAPSSGGGAELDRRGAELGAERKRLEQSARSSAVMVRLAARPEPALADDEVQRGGADRQGAAGNEGGASQAAKLRFAVSGEGEVNPNRLAVPPSKFTLSAGTIIPASLITGLNSDLPGMVVAQVTENVLDSATGAYVLIPQGARLIGSYDSAIAYGQQRALLAWTRIVFPDGSSIRLDKMPAVDGAGHAGLEDKVDFHSWRLAKGVLLSTLVGVGAEVGAGGRGGILRALRQSGEDNVSDAAAEITKRNLDVQPTLKVRPGWPVRALVNKDFVLQPWRG